MNSGEGVLAYSERNRTNERAAKNSPISRQPGVIDQAVRSLIFSQLKGLKHGSLEICEGNNRWLFGDVQNDDLPQIVMTIHDPACYRDMAFGGSIGVAEAFMTGDWETNDLTALIQLMARNLDVLDSMESGLAAIGKPVLKWFHKSNANSEKGSRRNIAAHYDLGNDFFKLFLDPTMMYSSGIFPDAQSSLEEASVNKLNVICEALQLSEADHVVEIGTGWGGFAVYAAENYGCRVTTTTISAEQYKEAQQRIQEAGVDHLVTLLLKDYRALEGKFDKLVSIEMIEAVGWQFYGTFFQKCTHLLKPGGQALIQAITIRDQRYEYAKKNVDFIQKYIFPGSCIPSIQALLTANMKAGELNLIKQYDFGKDYARTLHAWHDNLLEHQGEVRALGYPEEFIRMWRFYLSYCEGGFLERNIGVSHLIFER